MSTKNKFYSWIKKQKNRDDPIGDLAKDIISDRKFPKSIDNLKTHTSYLVYKGACQGALDALNIAWNEYINYKGEKWMTSKKI